MAVAGSLLGVAIHQGESAPVGKVDIIRLYPMSFEEFLLAKGEREQDWMRNIPLYAVEESF